MQMKIQNGKLERQTIIKPTTTKSSTAWRGGWHDELSSVAVKEEERERAREILVKMAMELNGGGEVECNGEAWIGVVARRNSTKGER